MSFAKFLTTRTTLASSGLLIGSAIVIAPTSSATVKGTRYVGRHLNVHSETEKMPVAATWVQ